jgi:hypothetical protein
MLLLFLAALGGDPTPADLTPADPRPESSPLIGKWESLGWVGENAIKADPPVYWDFTDRVWMFRWGGQYCGLPYTIDTIRVPPLATIWASSDQGPVATKRFLYKIEDGLLVVAWLAADGPADWAAAERVIFARRVDM